MEKGIRGFRIRLLRPQKGAEISRVPFECPRRSVASLRWAASETLKGRYESHEQGASGQLWESAHPALTPP